MWLFVYVQQGWQVAGSKHCVTVNGRDLHSVCKPQPCLKYCRCQSCTSWDLYPKSPFYSHGKALQIFFLLQSWEDARENFNSWGNAKILKFLILFSVPAFVSSQSLNDNFLASCSPFPPKRWLLPLWLHSMEVLWEWTWPTLQRVFFQWEGPLQQQQKLSRVLWRRNEHTQGRWSLPCRKTVLTAVIRSHAGHSNHTLHRWFCLFLIFWVFDLKAQGQICRCAESSR